VREVAIPFCQALLPAAVAAAVAALAWAILRFITAAGGSCCALTQRLTVFTSTVPVIPMPHMLIRPPVATRANPTIIAFELIWTPVVDGRLLVMVSPDVGSAQLTSFPRLAAAASPVPGDLAGSRQAGGPPLRLSEIRPGGRG